MPARHRKRSINAETAPADSMQSEFTTNLSFTQCEVARFDSFHFVYRECPTFMQSSEDAFRHRGLPHMAHLMFHKFLFAFYAHFGFVVFCWAGWLAGMEERSTTKKSLAESTTDRFWAALRL